MAEERRVEQGQKVGGAMSHRTFNTMLELVRQQRLGRLGREGGQAFADSLAGGLLVIVRNDTDTFQAAGNVLAINQGTPADPENEGPDFLGKPCFSGALPLETSDVVGVLRDGVQPGEVAPAVVLGLAVVELNLTSVFHRSAVPVPLDSSLMKSTAGAGAPILWTATGETGAQTAVVLLTQAAGAGGDCCDDCDSVDAVESATVSNTGSSFGISVPGGALTVAIVSFSGTVTPPAGWVEVYSASGWWIGYRLAVDDEGATWSFSISSGQIRFASYSNATVEDSDVDDDLTVTSSTAVAPSVTAPDSGRRLLVILGESDSHSAAVPSGMAEAGYGNTVATSRVRIWSQEDLPEGATGTRTSALGGARNWVAAALVLGKGTPETGTTWQGDKVVCGKVVELGEGYDAISGGTW